MLSSVGQGLNGAQQSGQTVDRDNGEEIGPNRSNNEEEGSIMAKRLSREKTMNKMNKNAEDEDEDCYSEQSGQNQVDGVGRTRAVGRNRRRSYAKEETKRRAEKGVGCN